MASEAERIREIELEVERKREAVREYYRINNWTLLHDSEYLSKAFPLPEKPKKLRTAYFDGADYRWNNGVLEVTWDGKWAMSLLKIDEIAAVASLKDRPFEEEP